MAVNFPCFYVSISISLFRFFCFYASPPYEKSRKLTIPLLAGFSLIALRDLYSHTHALCVYVCCALTHNPLLRLLCLKRLKRRKGPAKKRARTSPPPDKYPCIACCGVPYRIIAKQTHTHTRPNLKLSSPNHFTPIYPRKHQIKAKTRGKRSYPQQRGYPFLHRTIYMCVCVLGIITSHGPSI